MDIAFMTKYLPMYERAAVLTVKIGLIGIAFAILLGLICAISLMDLMFTAKDLIGLYYKTTESLFLLVVFYLIILLPVSLLGTWLERRVRYAGFGD